MHTIIVFELTERTVCIIVGATDVGRLDDRAAGTTPATNRRNSQEKLRKISSDSQETTRNGIPYAERFSEHMINHKSPT